MTVTYSLKFEGARHYAVIMDDVSVGGLYQERRGTHWHLHLYTGPDLTVDEYFRTKSDAVNWLDRRYSE